MHLLPGNAAPDRRLHLRNYLLCCIQDNVFSWADLTSPAILDRLLKAISSDLAGVVKDLGREGGASAARLIGAKILQLANDLGNH